MFLTYIGLSNTLLLNLGKLWFIKWEGGLVEKELPQVNVNVKPAHTYVTEHMQMTSDSERIVLCVTHQVKNSQEFGHTAQLCSARSLCMLANASPVFKNGTQKNALVTDEIPRVDSSLFSLSLKSVTT